MPTGNLPASGKKLWEEVYNKALKGSCKDNENPKECAAGSAWKAVKQAGWKKDSEGNWHKKAALTEFSLRIERASYDKASNERRWRAVASDIDEDSYSDNMSLELFSDFIGRIEREEKPPEEYCSSAWCGGMPYLSVSHYSDLEGDGIPGDIENVFMDGAYLKAKGIFKNTELGRRAFEAVCADLYNEERSEANDKVRISIGFLDYKHKHKANGFIFVRESLDDICPECIRELISGEYEGREFLAGHLIHLALTRVPVNERTSMEVERSMTTREEDAASIIGEDLAEELEEKELAKFAAKSQAFVTHSDAEDEEPEDEDKDEESMQEYDMEDKKKKKEEKADFSKEEIKSLIAEILEEKTMTEEVTHPLEGELQNLKSQYDAIVALEAEPDEKLQQIQKSYNALGERIVSLFKGDEPEQKSEVGSGVDYDMLVKAFGESMQPLAQKIDLLTTQLTTQQPVQMNQAVPPRRAITQPPPQQVVEKQSETPKLRAILRKSVQ